MNARLFAWIWLAVGLVASSLLSAQTAATVRDRVRQAMRAQQPGWQITVDNARDQTFTFVWLNRAETIAIVYDQRPSVQAATDWFAETTRGIAAGGGKPVAGVGDEALIFASPAASGGATFYLRKGTGSAVISAPSTAMASTIAQLVVAQIY